MKLKEGMYVRTESGIIEKINRIYDRHTTDNIVVWLNGYGDGKSVFIDDFEEIKFQSINSRGFIKKEPSFNPIDLIEVGDYVNGFKVYEVKENCVLVGYECFATKFNDEEEFLYQTIYENDIKSIVTKEMYSNVEYRVEAD